MTLLEAPELPSRLPSNSLSPDSVARLVSAAAAFAAEAALDALKRLYRAGLPLTLPIDIMTPIAIARTGAIGRGPKNLRTLLGASSWF